MALPRQGKGITQHSAAWPRGTQCQGTVVTVLIECHTWGQSCPHWRRRTVPGDMQPSELMTSVMNDHQAGAQRDHRERKRICVLT